MKCNSCVACEEAVSSLDEMCIYTCSKKIKINACDVAYG